MNNILYLALHEALLFYAVVESYSDQSQCMGFCFQQDCVANKGKQERHIMLIHRKLYALAQIYHNLKTNIQLNTYNCVYTDTIPPEFRYRFPRWTDGYLDASPSSGQQKPSAENTTRASKCRKCSSILSTPDSKITS